MLRGAFFHEGHEHDDFSHEHDDGAGLPFTWALDNVDLTTVGVDVGSSTSHLLFAHLHLQRLSESLSSRFVVTERDVLHRSPILLTPYRADGLIDVEALEQANARNVAELFAGAGGKFVCASAGHNLEGILAAHGSGAVALSEQRATTLLHIDVGGGTTKLGVLRNGEVVHTAAIHVGGRLVAFDDQERVTRIEPSGAAVAADLGIPLALGSPLSPDDRRRMADALAGILLDYVCGRDLSPLAQSFLLTEPLELNGFKPDGVTWSGGVAEYIYGREPTRFGDLGLDLAAALQRAAQNGGLPAATVNL